MIFEAFLRSLGLKSRAPKKEVTPEGVAAALQAILEYNLKVLEAVAQATETRIYNIESVIIDLIHRVEALEKANVAELEPNPETDPAESLEPPVV